MSDDYTARLPASEPSEFDNVRTLMRELAVTQANALDLRAALRHAEGLLHRANNALESDADLEQRRSCFEAIQDHFDPPPMFGQTLATTTDASALREIVDRAATEAYTAGARQKAADDGEDCYIVEPAAIAVIVDRILRETR